eukprot:TRINITY_DN101828_c0_g1_i1.p1 TRINITY_DN101828_c0_g1~~TRINITY_DN101828_c0_g1_i1.p1  ORF type:complete len:274 (+),score=93.37 TRINITY_DN101828_c0_g1_i1:73-894(+)
MAKKKRQSADSAAPAGAGVGTATAATPKLAKAAAAVVAADAPPLSKKALKRQRQREAAAVAAPADSKLPSANSASTTAGEAEAAPNKTEEASLSKRARKKLRREETAKQVAAAGADSQGNSAGTTAPPEPADGSQQRKKRRKGAPADVDTAAKPQLAEPAAPAGATRAEIDGIFAKKPKKAEASGAKDGAKGGAAKPKEKRHMAPSKGSAANPLGLGNEWMDDGLGGIYNNEGWTGRKTDGDGLRIFKRHLIKASYGDGGNTPQCPFDCQCCF